MSRVTLQKIGSEYVMNIPSDVIAEMGIKTGSVLELHVDKNHILEVKPTTDTVQDEALSIHDELIEQFSTTFEKLAK